MWWVFTHWPSSGHIVNGCFVAWHWLMKHGHMWAFTEKLLETPQCFLISALVMWCCQPPQYPLCITNLSVLDVRLPLVVQPQLVELSIVFYDLNTAITGRIGQELFKMNEIWFRSSTSVVRKKKKINFPKANTHSSSSLSHGLRTWGLLDLKAVQH